MVETHDIKVVSEYTGFDFDKCLNLDCITFKILLKDGLIYKLRQNENGIKYLEDCALFIETKADKISLRKVFGGGK